MTEDEIRKVADTMVSRHGVGASLLAYQRIVQTMKQGHVYAAENWCTVLLEIESMLNRMH